MIEAIEHARDEIRETMRDLLLAEEGLSEAAFLTWQGKNEDYAGASEHVRNAQSACVRLCCASDAWLHTSEEKRAGQGDAGKYTGHCTGTDCRGSGELMCDDRQETRAGENEEQRERRSRK